MSGNKHPILMVFIILGAVGLGLGLVMLLVLTFIGSSGNFSFGNKIGVIPIEGNISNPEPIIAQLIQFKKDDRIKAIILRIDSPGGQVGPSQEIYREVRKTIKTKKVVVSMGSLAASGGYYIASAADKIVANPGTITGSIGVIMEFIQLQELLGKIGVGLEVLTSGEFKDIGSPHRKMTEKDKELLRTIINDIQEQFVNAVAKGRDLSVEKVREIADGRILTGAKAKELGLVDVLGNFRDAVDLAKKMTGITGEVTLVYPRKSKITLLDLIFRNTSESLSRAIVDALRPELAFRWDGF